MMPIDLAKEMELPNYQDTATAQMYFQINENRYLHLYIWTRQLDKDGRFVMIAKLYDHAEHVGTWADIVRNYVDMTHVRNWILRDLQRKMDAAMMLRFEKLMKRHVYVRTPAVYLRMED